MSSMRVPNPIAICVSDLHLTLLRPACRADKDWMETQTAYLLQVKQAASYGGRYLPILCAGDIFDRWNAPPELINFALQHLPDGMLCVPGQHDLPNHRLDLMHRSGYGVLKEAGKIADLSKVRWALAPGGKLVVFGFGWEKNIEPVGGKKREHLNLLHVALVHRYVWTADKKFPGAPAQANVSHLKESLKGYDIAICGDNHQSFLAQSGQCQVLNVGGFIRRKTDEMDYESSMGVIYSDGSIKRRRLDTSMDYFQEVPKDPKEIPFDMKTFIEGLGGLGEHGLNFKEAVENYLKANEVNAKTREIILTAMEPKP